MDPFWIVTIMVVIVVLYLLITKPAGLFKQGGQDWPESLYGNWMEVNPYDVRRRIKLTFSAKKVSVLDGDGQRCRVSYQTAFKNKDRTNQLDMYTVIIQMADRPYEYVYHIEEKDGNRVAVLSEIMMELDGRGEIVAAEFLKLADFNLYGDAYRSAYAISRDTAIAPPTHME